MRHTVIVGASKTGTTGLFYAVVRGLEETGEPIYSLYEKHAASTYDSLDKYAPERLVVAKLLVTNKEFDSDVAAPFKYRILIVRDPRDTLVSALLFFPILAVNANVDAAAIDAFADLIRRKEQDPRSIPIRTLLGHGYALLTPDRTATGKFAARFNKTIRYHEKVPSFVVKYESFVDGDLAGAEEYLSMKLGERAAGSSRSHISRSGRYGGWRSWFVAEDVEHFRPLLARYMQRYGYEDDWELPAEPVIDPATASAYVERSSAARRAQRELLSRSALSSDERVSLLRARADTGNATFAVRLAEILLADGAPEASTEAVERLTFAASAGSPRAMTLLSNCYRDGVGVRQDRSRAKYWRGERRSLKP